MRHNLLQKSLHVIILLAVVLLAAAHSSYSRQPGEPGKIALRVVELQQQGVNFRESNLFTVNANPYREAVTNTLKNYTLLQINRSTLTTLLQTKPDNLRMTVPSNTGTPMNLLLYKVNISANGFTLLTSDGRSYNELTPVVHYRGMIENNLNSVVSFSFSEEETMGLICNDDGNYVVGELDNATGGEYVFYNDKDFNIPFSYTCGTNTNNPAKDYQQQQQNGSTPQLLTTNCVDWYYEIDYDIYVGKGSNLSNVNSYVQGFFNQVSTLYNNDGVSITLQTLYVWTSTDPYTGPSTSNYLTQFGNYRTSFAGDLANLIGYAGGGGVAWLDQLCGSTSHRMGYCGISSGYNTVPAYSWTVEVVTHEDGHLLGSNHTHDCVWNGNNTAIDGCGDQAGYNGSGSCATGPLPASGTIMSYCHLVSGVGINFNNGFGPQPLARILSEVNNASCLAACTACQTPSQPGTISGLTSYCQPTSQVYSVTPVAGATSYTWSLPSGWTGSSTTNSITVTQGSNGGTVSVIAINSCGNSTPRTLTVTGNTAPGQAGNMTGNSSVCQGSSQTYSVSAVSGATSYTWTLPAGWSGSSTTNSITATPGAIGGTVSVAASNSCGTSSPRTMTVSVSTLPAQPGSISGGASVCSGTSQTYSVSSVSGATSYTWTLPAGWSGSSTSNSITATTGANGGTVSVTANNSCGSGNARTLTVSINATPSAPGAISGNASVCINTSYTYSVSAVAGATSYAWVLPAGWSGNSTSNSITVISGTSGGTISVTASNSCGASQASTLATTEAAAPTQPSAISTVGGAAKVCPGTVKTYTIPSVSGATSYLWTAPVGGVITGGQGTTSATVTYNAGFIAADTLEVVASNGCSVSPVRWLKINRNTPATPSTVSGNSTGLCSGSNIPFSVTNISGMVYNWTFTTATASVNTGQGTNSISASFTPNFSVDTLKVTANNACGASAARKLTVKSIAAQPGSITGTTTPCANQQSVPYSITPVFGATTYIWTVPTGARIFDGTVLSVTNTLTTTATSVTVNFAATAGNVRVKTVNSCGTSANRSLAVSFSCRIADSENTEMELTAYPNPSHDEIHVQFEATEITQHQVKVIDLAGKTYLVQEGTSVEGKNELLLDIRSLSPGIYFLEVINGTQRSIEKIGVE